MVLTPEELEERTRAHRVRLEELVCARRARYDRAPKERIKDLHVDWKLYAEHPILRECILSLALEAVYEGARLDEADWLYEALHEEITTDRMRQRSAEFKQAVDVVGTVMFVVVCDMGLPDDLADVYGLAKEKHFRTATELLNAEGLACTPASVKKAWQRHWR